jgi:hypothetical protein
MIIPDCLNDAEGLLDWIIAVLRSDNISKDDLEHIADMLEPKSSKTKFRLKLIRRPGNRQQAGNEWYERLCAFVDIYDALDGNEKEAIDQAELPKEDGGMGVSRTTAKKYLDAWKAHLLAQREALDDSGGNSAA